MVSASDWVGFTLPGMIEEPGSFSGRINSPRPDRGPEPSSLMSLAILNKPVAIEASRSLCEYDGVVRCERLELVLCAHEGQTCELGYPRGNELGELGLAVEPGAYRGAALRQRIKLLEHGIEPCSAVPDLRRIARELLAERERRCVLSVGAADLDDMGELLCFFLQRLLQVRHRRDESESDLLDRRDMHRGRKAIVRGLAHIDVVVGVYRRLLAPLSPQHLVRPGCDYLVDVHIGLGARSGLPYH